MNKKIQEVYQYKGNGSTTVTVKIDYIKNKISFVEDNSETWNIKPKQWLFKDRGVEYMNGWINILQTMQEACEDAKQKYLANKESNEEKDIEKFRKMAEDLFPGL